MHQYYVLKAKHASILWSRRPSRGRLGQRDPNDAGGVFATRPGKLKLRPQLDPTRPTCSKAGVGPTRPAFAKSWAKPAKFGPKALASVFEAGQLPATSSARIGPMSANIVSTLGFEFTPNAGSRSKVWATFRRLRDNFGVRGDNIPGRMANTSAASLNCLGYIFHTRPVEGRRHHKCGEVRLRSSLESMSGRGKTRHLLLGTS